MIAGMLVDGSGSSSSQGRSHLGGALVPAKAACFVWWGWSLFGGTSAGVGSLGGVGL